MIFGAASLRHMTIFIFPESSFMQQLVRSFAVIACRTRA
jgi:hypothetical protein